jgi:two-component system, NarL family, sensor kinase
MDPADRPRSTRRAPTLLAATGTALVVVAFASMLLRGRPTEVIYARWVFHNAPTAIALLWLGWALVRRRPGHGLGQLFLVAGAAAALHTASICLADARLVAAGIGEGPHLRFAPAELPLDASVPFWFSSWLWLIPAGSAGTLLLLLFPDGRLPSSRWRPLVPVIGVGVGLYVAAYMVAAWPTSEQLLVMTAQPLHTPWPRALALGGASLLLVATLASVASLGVRWRRSSADERRQLRTVGSAGALMALGMTLLWPWQSVWVPASMVLVFGFFATYAVAVLRSRLHDLDVAVNRTVVASLLAVLVTAVYLGVVVGIGSLVGRSSERPLLPLVAVGVVAVLFEPARRRVRRLVDRLLYGRDADAYEVLTELAGQLRDASADTVTGRVTELLVRGTGAEGAGITIAVDGGRHLLAATGEVGASPVLTASIVHDGEVLGEVGLHARSSSDVAPDAPALLENVAGTLGAVLRNARLTAQLQAQIEELRRSRHRLLTAQDQARRELERDLHDGAQTRLIALRLQLGIATSKVAALADEDDVGALTALLEGLGDEADAAIRSLRDLSRGLHPPVLESHGVAAAVRAGARGLPIDVVIEADGLCRYPPQVEAAVYFSCLEAVKNAATHAGARRVRVAIQNGGGRLRFTVEDDGQGFDPTRTGDGRGLSNLDDRLAGLGGQLTIDAAVGRGTRLVGELPVQPLVSER